MFFIFPLLTIISTFLLVDITQSQRLSGKCESGSNCVFLNDCPPLLELVRSRSREGLQKVRNAICGFRNRRSMVCCPSSAPKTTTKKPFIIEVPREDLLPEFCGLPETADRIIGGAPAPIGAYPWLAAIGYSEPGKSRLQFHCAGSVISSKYVLTAAHCVVQSELGNKKLEVIHLGDWDLSTDTDCQVNRRGATCNAPHIVAKPEEVIPHEEYDKRARYSDDIALIRLDVSIDFNRVEAAVQPVCLPTTQTEVRSLVGTQRPVAAGWGLTEHGNHSNIMLRVNVPLVDNSKCEEKYKDDFIGKQLCVGGEGMFDTCNGDSGGPLVIHNPLGPPFYQIGIVSFGPFPCGLKNFPGVYTDVKGYRDWIIRKLRP